LGGSAFIDHRERVPEADDGLLDERHRVSNGVAVDEGAVEPAPMFEGRDATGDTVADRSVPSRHRGVWNHGVRSRHAG
jgi:hypothetical protein